MKDIFIFGVGAIGSNLALNLAFDRKDLKYYLIDFDKVEERNIRPGTQNYFKDQLQMLKAKALMVTFYRLVDIKAESVIQEVKTVQDIENICGSRSSFEKQLIIDAFDNKEARTLLYEYGKKNGVPVFHIGFSPARTFEITWNERYEVPEKDDPGDVCELEGMRSFIVFVCGLASTVIQHFLETGEKKDYIGNRFIYKEI